MTTTQSSLASTFSRGNHFILFVTGGIILSLPFTSYFLRYGLLSLFIFSLATCFAFHCIYRGQHPGIKHHGNYFSPIKSAGTIAWVLGFMITGFYIVLYFYDDLLSFGMPKLLENWVRMLDPLAMALHGGSADRWLLYGTFYTIAVLVMGYRMLLKYRGNRYQQVRTCSVMFFQLGFSFLIPAFLKRINQPEFYFTYFWPLKYDYLFPQSIDYLVKNGSRAISWWCGVSS